jgi:hypothetical protein
VNSSSAPMALPSTLGRIVDRLTAAFLILLLAVGSLALWIAVPLGCLHLAWRLAGTSGEAYLLALGLTVAGMVCFGAFLVWVNRLYLRVSGVIARYEAEEETYGRGTAPRFLRGPLEPLLVVSLLVAIAALLVWFLGFAHSPNPSISAAP